MVKRLHDLGLMAIAKRLRSSDAGPAPPPAPEPTPLENFVVVARAIVKAAGLDWYDTVVDIEEFYGKIVTPQRMPKRFIENLSFKEALCAAVVIEERAHDIAWNTVFAPMLARVGGVCEGGIVTVDGVETRNAAARALVQFCSNGRRSFQIVDEWKASIWRR